MKIPTWLGLAAAVVVVVCAAARSAYAGEAPATPPISGGSDADRRVLDLLAEDFEAQKRSDPLEASRLGDRRFDAQMPDLSASAREAYLAGARERLEKLKGVEPVALTPANRVNAALLAYELQSRLDGAKFKGWQRPVTQQGGPQQLLPQLPETISFTTDKQLEDYVTRLEKVPAYLEQMTANMREGLKEGRTPARVVMGSVAQQALVQGGDQFQKDPASHLMFKPLAGRADPLGERGKAAIREKVAPAFTKFGEFLRDEYVPKCREAIAASEGPDGPEHYGFLIRRMTTLDLAAPQIHKIGLGEVARIREEMMGVIARSDFARKGELKGEGLFAAFIAYLRTDPRFYFTRAEDLLGAYRQICKRTDAELPRLFGTLPRLSYGVREMASFIAPSAPTAYYYPGSLDNGVAGFFIANTYRLDQRPKYEMIPLALHESVPGHHLQISLAQELKHAGMPEWRTTADYTSFVEGWGLYSERLGLEMGDTPARTPRSSSGEASGTEGGGGRGFYEDPYDDFGRLSYEMWRAMRLVVDTGMHALGWSRQRSIDYMLANSALTRENIEREVDRYIATPGQALAYKLGELRIRDLRSEAEAELGDKFDIRGFHDAVLGQGAVPLELLARQVKEWVAARKRGD